MTIEDLRSFEPRHGRIPRDAAVLMYSGWGAKVGDPDAQGSGGQASVFASW